MSQSIYRPRRDVRGQALTNWTELARYVAFRPDGPSPTPKHDPWIDAWRAARVALEVERAARGLG